MRQKLNHEVGSAYKKPTYVTDQQSDADLIKELLGALFGAVSFAGFLIMLALFL